MAEEGNIYGGGGLFDNEASFKPGARPHGRRRGGEASSDFDGLPGSSEDSKDYAGHYDPRGLKEIEPGIGLGYYDKTEWERRNAAASRREGVVEAQKRIKWHEVGKHYITEKTWAAHARLVKDPDTRIGFDPEYYKYFDKVFAEALGNDAVTDPEHPQYAKYEGLRTNIAVLRNALYAHYMQDGRFDPEDEDVVPKVEAIAHELGQSLSAGSGMGSVLFPSIGLELANQEAVGAAVMYRHLVERQDNHIWPEFANRLRNGFASLLRITTRDWELPPIEETPFSIAGLSAPPPKSPQELAAEAAQAAVKAPAAAPAVAKDPSPQAAIVVATEHALDTASKLRHVENMQVDAKAESVERAKDIIRWLRNLQFQEMDVQNWLDQGAPPDQAAKAEGLAVLMMTYQNELAKLPVPERLVLMRDSAIQDANDAGGGAALALGYQSLLMLKKDSQRAKPIEERMVALPEKLEFQRGLSAAQLITAIEAGLERIVKRRLNEHTVHERLNEMANHTAKLTNRMRKVDAMDDPPRVESVELGKEILRKLRQLQMGKDDQSLDAMQKQNDKPLGDLIRENSPEDNLKLAGKLSDMVESYNNLVAEASSGKKQYVLERQAIKEATDTAGTASNAIKLAAILTMPNSIAAAQQISTDQTKDADEVGKLNKLTINRLIESMEGGMEAAIHEAQAQEQDEAQDQELQAEIAESALQSDDLKKRRKRGRKRSTVTGLGGAKARKVAMDISADDYKLGQGKFSKSGGLPEKRAQKAAVQAPETGANIPADVRAAIDGMGMRNLGAEWNDQLKTSPVNQQPAANSAQSYNPAAPNNFDGNAVAQVTAQDQFQQAQQQAQPQNSGSGGGGSRSGGGGNRGNPNSGKRSSSRGNK